VRLARRSAYMDGRLEIIALASGQAAEATDRLHVQAMERYSQTQFVSALALRRFP
jgi:hypothetical protein